MKPSEGGFEEQLVSMDPVDIHSGGGRGGGVNGAKWIYLRPRGAVLRAKSKKGVVKGSRRNLGSFGEIGVIRS